MQHKQKIGNIVLGRKLRDFREMLRLPLWLLTKRPPPDNHQYKTRRIKRIGREFECTTFIETGTFFGQTVAAVADCFDKVYSVELSDELFQKNRDSFFTRPNIVIFHGDSGRSLGEMISQSDGRVLFWLDGHYSGGFTAIGENITPIFSELKTIQASGRSDHCILIDDARLFGSDPGYPSLEALTEALLAVNPQYIISLDCDCLLALPPR